MSIIDTLTPDALTLIRLAREAYDALSDLRKTEMRVLQSEDPERYQYRIAATYIRAVETQGIYNQALNNIGEVLTAILDDPIIKRDE